MLFYRWLPQFVVNMLSCALGGVLLHSLGVISSCLADTSLLRPGICSFLSTPRHQVVNFPAFDRSGWCLSLLCSQYGRAGIDFVVGCAEDPLPSSDRYRALKPLVTPAFPWSPWLLLRSSPGLSCLLWQRAWSACQWWACGEWMLLIEGVDEGVSFLLNSAHLRFL